MPIKTAPTKHVDIAPYPPRQAHPVVRIWCVPGKLEAGTEWQTRLDWLPTLDALPRLTGWNGKCLVRKYGQNKRTKVECQRKHTHGSVKGKQSATGCEYIGVSLVKSDGRRTGGKLLSYHQDINVNFPSLKQIPRIGFIFVHNRHSKHQSIPSLHENSHWIGDVDAPGENVAISLGFPLRLRAVVDGFKELGGKGWP